jgi:hypothetical protein
MEIFSEILVAMFLAAGPFALLIPAAAQDRGDA